MSDTFATRRFTFRDAHGNDHVIARGTDLSTHEPKIPDQQLDDWRGVDLVGANPDAKPADEKPAGKTSGTAKP